MSDAGLHFCNLPIADCNVDARGLVPTVICGPLRAVGSGIVFDKWLARGQLMLNERSDLIVRESSFRQLQSVLDQARKAIRLAEYAQAQLLLDQSLRLSNREAADYFNLTGACCEGRKQWRHARKNYVKSISILNGYQPARLNLQRLIQLRSGGIVDRPIQLGDEPADLWFVHAPIV